MRRSCPCPANWPRSWENWAERGMSAPPKLSSEGFDLPQWCHDTGVRPVAVSAVPAPGAAGLARPCAGRAAPRTTVAGRPVHRLRRRLPAHSPTRLEPAGRGHVPHRLAPPQSRSRPRPTPSASHRSTTVDPVRPTASWHRPGVDRAGGGRRRHLATRLRGSLRRQGRLGTGQTGRDRIGRARNRPDRPRRGRRCSPQTQRRETWPAASPTDSDNRRRGRTQHDPRRASRTGSDHWAYLESSRPIALAPVVSASRACCQAGSRRSNAVRR